MQVEGGGGMDQFVYLKTVKNWYLYQKFEKSTLPQFASAQWTLFLL
jgi:hypothetical protein